MIRRKLHRRKFYLVDKERKQKLQKNERKIWDDMARNTCPSTVSSGLFHREIKINLEMKMSSETFYF